MGATWQQWSAASLASGAVLLVLGSLMLPTDGGDVSGILVSVTEHGEKWVMAAFAFLLASVTLTLGMPSVLTLLRQRGHRLGLVGVGTWAMGSIGLAGYAALLVFFETVVPIAELTPADGARVADDGTLQLFVGFITVAFVLGELLTAIAFLVARTVPVWVAVLLLLHALTASVAELMPEPFERGQVILFGVALMGIAVRANDAHPRRVR
jgi:hypothetical protein